MSDNQPILASILFNPSNPSTPIQPLKVMQSYDQLTIERLEGKVDRLLALTVQLLEALTQDDQDKPTYDLDGELIAPDRAQHTEL